MQDTSRLKKTPSAAEAWALGARDRLTIGGQEAVSGTRKAPRRSQRYLHTRLTLQVAITSAEHTLAHVPDRNVRRYAYRLSWLSLCPLGAPIFRPNGGSRIVVYGFISIRKRPNLRSRNNLNALAKRSSRPMNAMWLKRGARREDYMEERRRSVRQKCRLRGRIYFYGGRKSVPCGIRIFPMKARGSSFWNLSTFRMRSISIFRKSIGRCTPVCDGAMAIGSEYPSLQSCRTSPSRLAMLCSVARSA